MRIAGTLALVRQNVGRNPKHYLFASVGIVVGVAMLSFFVALGSGVRERVLNTYFPVNQVELVPRTLGVLGIQGELPDHGLTPARLAALAALPGVASVHPKQRSRFQARLWGGAGLFGRDAHAEAFFDGMEPALVADELRRRERGGRAGPPPAGRQLACDRDDDCPAGFDCVDGACARHEFWTDFKEFVVHSPCERDEGCAPDLACIDAICQPEGGWPACESVADCSAGMACEAGRCALQACRLVGGAGDQDRETPAAIAGALVGVCANDAQPGTPACAPAGCPLGTYCAGRHAQSAEGVCQPPLPVVVNPFLVDVFNATAASALKLQRIADPRILLGLTFRMRFGDSFFVRGVAKDAQVTRRARVVGFSDKAPLLGLSVPLHVVKAANARFRGRDEARAYDAVVVVTRRNEDTSAVLEAADRMGFVLGPASQQARRLANMLLILTAVFGAISAVVMGVAAINIAHTFLMMVAERRGEIGILRALGATPGDIRALILVEAGLVGIAGGVVGHGVAWGASRLANAVADRALRGLALLPDDFFAFPPAFLVASVAGAALFAVLGAWAAARQAARTDPAVVLSSP